MKLLSLLLASGILALATEEGSDAEASSYGADSE
jgi:hypothetical protein